MGRPVSKPIPTKTKPVPVYKDADGKVLASPENISTLKSLGYNNNQIAKITGRDRSTIGRLVERLESDRADLSKFTTMLPELFQDSMANAKESLDRFFKWFIGISDEEYRELPWTAKKGFADLALMAGTHAFNNYRLETGQSTANSAVFVQVLSKVHGSKQPQIVGKQPTNIEGDQ